VQCAPSPAQHNSSISELRRAESTPSQPEVADHTSAEEADVTAPVTLEQGCESFAPDNSADFATHRDSSASVQKPSALYDPPLMETAQPDSDTATTVVAQHSIARAEPRLVLFRSSDGPSDDSHPTAYVMKHHDGKVVEEDMQGSMSVGVLPKGGTLGQLTSLLEQVFMQSIVSSTKGTADMSKISVSQGQQTADDTELLAALQKFIGQLRTSEVHLTGSVQLTIPNVDSKLLTAKDDDVLMQLESTLHEWTIVLQDVKHAEAEKSAQGDGPLDEIHFWGERNNVLGGLHEQINHGRSQAIVE
jgi:hypothetical protein